MPPEIAEPAAAPLPKTPSGTPPAWNLAFLFDGPGDPRIEASWTDAHAKADALAALRGTVESGAISPEDLAAALGRLEDLMVESYKPLLFAGLRYAADASDPANGAFYQAQSEKGTALNVKLMFLELELQGAPGEAVEGWLAHPAMEEYAHYLKMVRVYAPFRLSESEEVLLEETANTGSRAWNRLFDEVLSNGKYLVDGESLNQSGVLDLLREADRAKRLAGAEAFSKGLEANERVLTFVFNTLLQDKAVGDRLRGYDEPETARHLSNELAPETVAMLERVCRENYGLVARYYRVKKRLLGLDELTHVDRYAPLKEPEGELGWDRAREICLASFARFSGRMSERAAEFFDREWIDAAPRDGKRGGAFCQYNTPDLNPVVLMSYNGKLDDVMTLAHELGHGVHAALSRGQNLFDFHGTLPMAELASTFGEMLVFESLVAEASHDDRVALYGGKIEGVFATVFRQIAMYAFERRLHRVRREEGELTPGRIGEIWQEEIGAMFGDSVKLGEEHRRWWSYVSHFTHSPFYVYAYSFGELVALSLYEKAREGGPEFAERYLDMLSLGGSKSPQELMDLLGVRLDDESFWRAGIAAVERLVATFEGLVA